jgi:hypothetical protein
MIMEYGKDCGNEFHLMLMSKAPIPTESVEKLQSAQITRFNQLDTSNLSDLGVSKKRLAYRGVIHQLPGDTLAECITRLITQSLGPKNDSISKLDPVTLLGILVDAMLNKSKTSHSPFPKAAEESATNAAIAFVSYAIRADADLQDTQSMFSALSKNIEEAISLGKEDFEGVLFDGTDSNNFKLKSQEEQRDALNTHNPAPTGTIVPAHPQDTAASLVHELIRKSGEIYNPEGKAEGGAPILEGETAEFRQQRLEQDIRILKNLGGDEGLFLGKNNGLISHSQRQQAIKAYFVSEYGGPTTELDRLKADIDNMHKQDGDISKFLGNERRLINHDDRQQVINRENEPANTHRR